MRFFGFLTMEKSFFFQRNQESAGLKFFFFSIFFAFPHHSALSAPRAGEDEPDSSIGVFAVDDLCFEEERPGAEEDMSAVAEANRRFAAEGGAAAKAVPFPLFPAAVPATPAIAVTVPRASSPRRLSRSLSAAAAAAAVAVAVAEAASEEEAEEEARGISSTSLAAATAARASASSLSSSSLKLSERRRSLPLFSSSSSSANP